LRRGRGGGRGVCVCVFVLEKKGRTALGRQKKKRGGEEIIWLHRPALVEEKEGRTLRERGGRIPLTAPPKKKKTKKKKFRFRLRSSAKKKGPGGKRRGRLLRVHDEFRQEIFLREKRRKGGEEKCGKISRSYFRCRGGEGCITIRKLRDKRKKKGPKVTPLCHGGKRGEEKAFFTYCMSVEIRGGKEKGEVSDLLSQKPTSGLSKGEGGGGPIKNDL